MMILKHSILDLLQEKEVVTLSELAQKLNTSESHILVTINQMMDSGTPVKLKDDIVYKSSKFSWLPYLLFAFLIGMIVFFPAVMGLN